jgi:hypothetical protein
MFNFNFKAITGSVAGICVMGGIILAILKIDGWVYFLLFGVILAVISIIARYNRNRY